MMILCSSNTFSVLLEIVIFNFRAVRALSYSHSACVEFLRRTTEFNEDELRDSKL